MSIKIREKKLKNKGKSLYLDICYKGRRSYEFLNMYIYPGSSNRIKEENKNMREKAEMIKTKRWGEILSSLHGVDMIKKKNDVNLLPFLRSKIEEMGEGSSKTIYDAALKQLVLYHRNKTLFPSDISERFLEEYYDHLVKNFKGETPITYFKRLKRLLGIATKNNFFTINPASDIRGRKYIRNEKPTLTEEEIVRLIKTECRNEDVKYGFLFSCNTGLRFSDINQLKWKDIKGSSITLIQQKTKNKLDVELSEDAVSILANQKRKNEKVFNLPTHTGCLKILRKWVGDAEIAKKIGWHNSRHTLGTTLAEKGVDIFTISKTLGHRSIAPTQRYVRESPRLKKEAVMKLPKLLNNQKD